MKGHTPEDVIRRWVGFQRQIGAVAGGVGTRFFKENFRKQGFDHGGSVDRWKPRAAGSGRDKGRAILVDTGRLRRSIRTVAKGKGWAVVGTDTPYAAAHNSGLRRKAMQNVKPHQRRRNGRLHRVKGHTRMANVNLPKRQFIGPSAALDSALAKELTSRLRRAGF